jgi:enterobactin synthetase component F
MESEDMANRRPGELPLSAAQSTMWLAQHLAPADWTYCIAQYIEVAGPLDPRLLVAAGERTFVDVEALRSRVAGPVDEPVLVVEPTAPPDLPVIDVTGHADPHAAAEAWMRTDLVEPIDLTRAPLYRTALFVAGPDRHFLYVRSHHLALDGYGAALFIARLAEVYTALAAGTPCPPATVEPLAALVADEAGYRASAQFAADREYWLRRCEDLPAPVRLLDGAAAATAGVTRSTGHLDAALADRLREVARGGRSAWSVAAIAAAAGSRGAPENPVPRIASTITAAPSSAPASKRRGASPGNLSRLIRASPFKASGSLV